MVEIHKFVYAMVLLVFMFVFVVDSWTFGEFILIFFFITYKITHYLLLVFIYSYFTLKWSMFSF